MPCFNEAVLVNVWKFVDAGLQELVSLQYDHLTMNDLKMDILRGQKTLVVITKDEAKDPVNDYVGFLITEHYQKSFHGYGIWIKPEFRNLETLKQVQDHFEATARKWTAPNVSFCTNYDQAALQAGYTKKYSFYEKKL
jgi:hypothetical protein